MQLRTTPWIGPIVPAGLVASPLAAVGPGAGWAEVRRDLDRARREVGAKGGKRLKRPFTALDAGA